VTIAALATLCACGDSGTRTPAKHARHEAPRPLDACTPPAAAGWRTLPARGIYGAPAARLGSGELGIVFANDSVNDTCEWTREAQALADEGYAVAVFEAGGGLEARQALTVGRALRTAGAKRVVLIGASVGARAVLEAGAMKPAGVSGLVALSAERTVSPNPGDLLPQVRGIRLPVLSIGSRRDPLTRFGRDTPAFARAFAHGRLLLVDGSAHGVELLRGRPGARVRPAIRQFLRDVAQPP
jgi:pimeloyl-ACP methyl ester carboxylesterase